eukprot:g619.t1
MSDVSSVLKGICMTGRYQLPWKDLSPIIKDKIAEVLQESHKLYPSTNKIENFDKTRDETLKMLSDFEQAPFTLQRLCEILSNFQAHYKSTHKLVHAINKLLAVTSTYPPSSSATQVDDVEYDEDEDDNAMVVVEDDEDEDNTSLGLSFESAPVSSNDTTKEEE